MKIAIISTRGIPNHYGGFEQFAEYLSVGLVERGHQVTVYSPHFHVYKKSEYKGVKIRHIYSPENCVGNSFGNFFYDFLSIRDALKNNKFDIIYVAGYTSVVPAYIYYNIEKIKNPVFVTNVDGLEWKRSKFNKLIQKFINWEENKVVACCPYLVTDNEGIQDYYYSKYGKKTFLISYGISICKDYSEKYLAKYSLKSKSYYLIIARLEPENNIETIIEGFIASQKKEFPLVIIGKKDTHYARKLLKKYNHYLHVFFLGGIYDMEELNSIRHYSFAYFHGHSVGGTNPSLLEAMATECFIISHDNIFNRNVIKDNALYFSNSLEIQKHIDSKDIDDTENRIKFIKNNLNRIVEKYLWKKIISEYELFFQNLYEKKNNF